MPSVVRDSIRAFPLTPTKELTGICSALGRLGDGACALATVVKVEGSAYRNPGSRMLITPDGQTEGMISGGCLEHDVIDHARRAMQSGQPRVVRYDSTTEDDPVFGVGSGCNGVIDVFIQALPAEARSLMIESVSAACGSRNVGGIATVIACGDGRVAVGSSSYFARGAWDGDDALCTLLNTKLWSVRLPADARIHDSPDGCRVFVQALLPPVQLVIFGGWLDVIPLVRLGREIGCRVIVVDTRRRLSSFRHFAEADVVLQCSAGEAVRRIALDERTVAVVMNHQFEEDRQALLALSDLSLPYIGVLGQRQRLGRILEALRAEKTLRESFLESVHGPVGLDIGARVPEEIAVSILSEILAFINQRNRPFRDRAFPPAPALPDSLYG